MAWKLLEDAVSGSTSEAITFRSGFDLISFQLETSIDPPVDLTVTIQGSLTGENFGALETINVNCTPKLFHITNRSMQYIRVALSGSYAGTVTVWMEEYE